MSGVQHLAIEGELSIYRAAELRQWLDDSLQPGRSVRLSLAGVTEMDTAGAQLLLAGQRLAAERACALHYTEPSDSVQALLALFDMSALLSDALKTPATEGSAA
jgi:anti-anti-sigma factor